MNLLSLVPWRGSALPIALLIVVCIGFGAIKMRAHDQQRYDALQTEYSNFKAGVQAQGMVAEAAKKKQEDADNLRKKKADDENAKTIADLNASVKRLRNQRSGSGFVPQAASSSIRPDLACFDRAELESALRGFDQSLQGIVDEGSAAAIGLDTAKQWAESR